MEQEAIEELTNLQASLPPKWRFAGHVWTTPEGKLDLIPAPIELDADHDLFAFTGRRGGFDWERVGIVRNGRFELKDFAGVPHGMPLFAGPPDGGH